MSKHKYRLKNIILSELQCTDLRIPVLCAAVSLILGIVSALATKNYALYHVLCLPAPALPALIFPILWSIIYIMLGFALGLVLAKHGKCYAALKIRAVKYFTVMFALSLVYSPVFFDMGAFFLAFLMICAMIALTFFILLYFSNISRLSGILMFAFWLWLLYCAYLNLAILFLNS